MHPQACVPRLRTLVIPLHVYLLQTLLFFCMSVLNNVAFNFRISQPVHVVVRSANLILTYVVGRIAGERCVPARALVHGCRTSPLSTCAFGWRPRSAVMLCVPLRVWLLCVV